MDSHRLHHAVRRVVSLILLATFIIVAVTGVILLFKSSIALYRLVPVKGLLAAKLHEYAAFVMTGAGIIHAYLNRHSIKSYVKALILTTEQR